MSCQAYLYKYSIAFFFIKDAELKKTRFMMSDENIRLKTKPYYV